MNRSGCSSEPAGAASNGSVGDPGCTRGPERSRSAVGAPNRAAICSRNHKRPLADVAGLQVDLLAGNKSVLPQAGCNTLREVIGDDGAILRARIGDEMAGLNALQTDLACRAEGHYGARGHQA